MKKIMQTNYNGTFNVNIWNIYIYIIMLMPISTLLQGYLNSVNKILFSLILLIQSMIILKSKINYKYLVIILVLSINHIFTISRTRFPLNSFNMLIYYWFMIYFFIFFILHKNKIMEYLLIEKKYVITTMRIWTVLVAISFFLPSSYYVKEAGTLYFGSFPRTIFRLGPAAIFVMTQALMAMVLYKNKRNFMYLIIPFICILLGSSRTYLIIGLSIFLIGWRWYINNEKKYYLSLIPIICILIFFVFYSSIGDKIMYSLSWEEGMYGDFWFLLSSGRSVLWEQMLNAYNNGDILGEILGYGLEFTNRISGLWAHNDFIEILCSFGIVGVINYLLVIRESFINILKRKAKVPVSIVIILLIVWLFNAFFNMFYTYFCSVISFPFLLLVVNEKYRIR